ncbi:HyaD/HybD family hydrogenase maturation endopeptidase, partial [Kaarinaea lacus]
PSIKDDPLLQDNQAQPVLVLGLGNILIQDEGIGVRVVEQLQRDYEFPAEVEVMDGGTAGMALYEHIVGRSHVIVVDAVKTGRAPGTLVKLDNEDVPAFFRNKVSPHQMALSDILAALKVGGEQLPEMVVVGIEPVILGTGLEMSEEVSGKLGALVDKTLECLRERGIEAVPVTRH